MSGMESEAVACCYQNIGS